MTHLYNYFYLNGNIKSIHKYSRRRKLKEINSYYPNGILKKIESFERNKLHGCSYFYFPNGKCSAITPYSSGNKNGIFRYYNRKGYLEESRIYDYDRLESISFYKNNSLQKRKTYYKNFQTKSKTFFKNDDKHGKEIKFYPDGSIYSRQNFIKIKNMVNIFPIMIINLLKKFAFFSMEKKMEIFIFSIKKII